MPAGKCQCGKCSCGDGRIRPSSRAKRGAARLFENCPSPLYKSQDAPRARRPLHSRPHAPTPRPHHHRRRSASSRFSRGSPLHQPPSIPKPGSHGSSCGNRSSRPPAATPPPPRSSFRPRFRPRPRRATVVPARFPGTRATSPERRRRSLRHRRRLRRRPSPQPSPDTDHRSRRRNLFRHQRRNSPKRPPQTSPLKRADRVFCARMFQSEHKSGFPGTLWKTRKSRKTTLKL